MAAVGPRRAPVRGGSGAQRGEPARALVRGRAAEEQRGAARRVGVEAQEEQAAREQRRLVWDRDRPARHVQRGFGARLPRPAPPARPSAPVESMRHMMLSSGNTQARRSAPRGARAHRERAVVGAEVPPVELPPAPPGGAHKDGRVSARARGRKPPVAQASAAPLPLPRARTQGAARGAGSPPRADSGEVGAGLPEPALGAAAPQGRLSDLNDAPGPSASRRCACPLPARAGAGGARELGPLRCFAAGRGRAPGGCHPPRRPELRHEGGLKARVLRPAPLCTFSAIAPATRIARRSRWGRQGYRGVFPVRCARQLQTLRSTG